MFFIEDEWVSIYKKPYMLIKHPKSNKKAFIRALQ